MPRVPLALTVIIWAALVAVSCVLTAFAWIAYREGDWACVFLLGLGIALTLCPPRFDPVIRWRERLEDR